MTNELKNFFGRTYKQNYFSFGLLEYEIVLNSKDEVINYYREMKERCYNINFNMNPFNSNAYGEFKLNGAKYVVGGIRQEKNGDRNWYEYADESKRVVTITTDDQSVIIEYLRIETINQIIK